MEERRNKAKKNHRFPHSPIIPRRNTLGPEHYAPSAVQLCITGEEFHPLAVLPSYRANMKGTFSGGKLLGPRQSWFRCKLQDLSVKASYPISGDLDSHGKIQLEEKYYQYPGKLRQMQPLPPEDRRSRSYWLVPQENRENTPNYFLFDFVHYNKACHQRPSKKLPIFFSL